MAAKPEHLFRRYLLLRLCNPKVVRPLVYGISVDMVNADHTSEYSAQHRLRLIRLLGRISLYYLILAVLVGGVITIFPGFIDQLPLGGVGEIANYGGPAVDDLEEALLSADDEELEEIATRQDGRGTFHEAGWIAGAISLFYAMFCTLLLMLPVSWVYKTIHDDSVYDHSLDETALVLPAVVAGIVLIVQHSLALAFSLAGIVAGVRFRRALSDTFDTLFIFVAIGVGIAAGIKSLEIAAVLSIFFNYATVFVCAFGDGLESQYLANRKRLRRQRKLERAAPHPETGEDAG
jgi:hypothetical protein